MIGQFVYSTAGHDKGTLYVVVAEDQQYVYLADGRLRQPSTPKKKKRKHIQPVLKTVEEPLLTQLRGGQLPQPEQLRRAIRLYEE